MGLGKRAMLHVALFLMSGVAVLFVLVRVDVFEHHKHEADSIGLNVNGYRGPALGKKQPGEFRLMVLGGSPAFGYGLDTPDTMPAQLGRMLQQRLSRPVTVANLAFNSEYSVCFPYLLDH